MCLIALVPCVVAEGPVSHQRGPEGQRWGEVAEEEVGDGEGKDERVTRIKPEFARAEDDHEK